jgi:hypothetical protein
LTLVENQVIEVTKEDDSGWWQVTLDLRSKKHSNLPATPCFRRCVADKCCRALSTERKDGATSFLDIMVLLRLFLTFCYLGFPPTTWRSCEIVIGGFVHRQTVYYKILLEFACSLLFIFLNFVGPGVQSPMKTRDIQANAPPLASLVVFVFMFRNVFQPAARARCTLLIFASYS